LFRIERPLSEVDVFFKNNHPNHATAKKVARNLGKAKDLAA
jgi:hypothetical protein